MRQQMTSSPHRSYFRIDEAATVALDHPLPIPDTRRAAIGTPRAVELDRSQRNGRVRSTSSAHRVRSLWFVGSLSLLAFLLALPVALTASPADAETNAQVDLASAVCRGIAGCTPVLSGWIDVPGETASRPGTTETTLSCVGDAIAANFGATGASGSKVGVTIDAVIAILNGIPYDRVFDASNSGGASSFQVAVGCVNIAGGSLSSTNPTPERTLAQALQPGETKEYSVLCPEGDTAENGEANVAFSTTDPPSADQVKDVSVASIEKGADFTVTVQTDPGLSPDGHPELELSTDCRSTS
jgi:hypothetical protein